MRGLRRRTGSTRRAAGQIPAPSQAGRAALVAAALAVFTGAGGARVAWALGNGATALTDVAVLSPPAADPLLVEAVTRVRAELGAAGLTSHLVSCVELEPTGPRACQATGGPPEPAVPGTTSAVVVLARDEGATTIEVIERLPDGSRFFRLVYVPAREGGRDPAVLGIRGVELLRDLHMDIERGNATPIVQAPPSPARPIAPEPEPPAPRESVSDRDLELEPERDRRRLSQDPGAWQVGVSLAGLRGRHLGPGIGAALEGSFAVRPWLTAFVLASGPFFGDLRVAAGTASTRQELALAGVRVALPGARLRAYGTAAMGGLHVKAAGTLAADRDLSTTSSALWAVAFAAGLGGALRATRFVDVRLEVDTVWAAPSGTITIANEVAERVGAPSFLALAGVGIWLP
ncbi:MAG TPA: hypothetical protein VIU64_20875 [Polyangia bacterium]